MVGAWRFVLYRIRLASAMKAGQRLRPVGVR
eukprot:SAG31_NODE_47366_length_247_cov_7.195946_1_plen_30_part_10